MPNSSMICVDANLAFKLVNRSASPAVETLFDGWRRQNRALVAPYLLRYEVTNAIRQMQRLGHMTDSIAAEAVTAMTMLPITLFADADQHSRALAHSIRFGLPAAYDAHYLALAEELDCEFWTTDKRLARTVQRDLAWVHLFE